MQLTTFELCKNKRTESRLRGLVCNFLCTNKGKCKFLISISTLFFCSHTIRKWLIGKSSLGFHVHDRESFRSFNEENENLKLQWTFENPFGQMLTSNWLFKLPSILHEMCSAPVLSLAQVTGKIFSYISLITLKNAFSMELPR